MFVEHPIPSSRGRWSSAPRPGRYFDSLDLLLYYDFPDDVSSPRLTGDHLSVNRTVFLSGLAWRASAKAARRIFSNSCNALDRSDSSRVG